MSLQKLDVYYVRNIQQLSFTPSAGLNFIFGSNASGKSALLEAIYILGRAKSFRSPTIKSVIQFDQTHLLISAYLTPESGSPYQLGIQLDGKQVDMHINHQPTLNRADLAYALPLQLIHPKSFALLDAGAKDRREFLDWGVFHSQPQFLDAWRHFKKVLAHRNVLLKTKKLEQLSVWNKELAYYGTIVNECRYQYLQQFLPVFAVIVNQFLDLGDITISLLSGWDKTKPLAQVLQDDIARDVRYGFTHSGSHRADLQITIQGRLVKDFLSRGQLKLLILSLKLAQIQLLAEHNGLLACILIDDFAAELDRHNRSKLLHYLANLSCQVFITANEQLDFGDVSHFSNCKMFHMEHGSISPV